MSEKELFERALNEINELRRSNELMRARLDMFDAVMSALHGEPAHQGGGLMHPDVVHEIRKKIMEYEQNQEK